MLHDPPSVQVPLQQVSPAPVHCSLLVHWHAPLLQAQPSVHAFVHEPQLSGSLSEASQPSPALSLQSS